MRIVCIGISDGFASSLRVMEACRGTAVLRVMRAQCIAFSA